MSSKKFQAFQDVELCKLVRSFRNFDGFYYVSFCVP